MAFRPAQRSEAKPLIGLYAESGAGKTWSSLLLARGYVGAGGKIGMIETEGGRGEANVGRNPVGDYLVRPIRGSFAPAEYGKAIGEAEAAKLDALIIDSASHEWEGAGGVLSLAAANQEGGKKGVLVWQQPKLEHQRHFMLRLMQTPIALVIVCMRAKYPMVEQINRKGEREWTRSKVLEPKQADDILFEMFVHGWISIDDHALHVTKYTLPELADVIRDGEPISIETGRRLRAWAMAGREPGSAPGPGTAPPLHSQNAPAAQASASPAVNSSRPNGVDASISPPPPPPGSTAAEPPAPAASSAPQTPTRSGAGAVPSWEDYCARWEVWCEEAERPEQAAELHASWTGERQLRNAITWPTDDTFDRLKAVVTKRIAELKASEVPT